MIIFVAVFIFICALGYFQTTQGGNVQLFKFVRLCRTQESINGPKGNHVDCNFGFGTDYEQYSVGYDIDPVQKDLNNLPL